MFSFYRPPGSDTVPLDQLNESLNCLYSGNNSAPNIVLAGDYNLPDVNWIDECGIPATNPAYGSVLNSLFINIINDHSLEQLVCSSTRQNNILDLVFSTQPDLISEDETIPGISDHEAITFTIRNIIHIQRKQPHKVYLYHKCNLDAIKVGILKFQQSFMQSDPYIRTVDDNWTLFKSFILDLLHKHVPQRHANLIKIHPGLILVLSVKYAIENIYTIELSNLIYQQIGEHIGNLEIR